MTEPIFYCYDNECGFTEDAEFYILKENAETALDMVDDFTEDTEIHYGLLIPFAKLVEKDGEFSLIDTTADDVRESIQELDKRGLNTTANELREKMLAVVGELEQLTDVAVSEETCATTVKYHAHMLGRGEAFYEAINVIKKALGES